MHHVYRDTCANYKMELCRTVMLGIATGLGLSGLGLSAWLYCAAMIYNGMTTSLMLVII